MTEKGNRLYVHILDWPDEVLSMPAIPKVRSAKMMANGSAVDIQQVNGATLLRVPQGQRDPVDTIVIIERG